MTRKFWIFNLEKHEFTVLLMTFALDFKDKSDSKMPYTVSRMFKLSVGTICEIIIKGTSVSCGGREE